MKHLQTSFYAFIVLLAVNSGVYSINLFDIQLTPLQDVSVDNDTATVRFYFKSEKCILYSRQNLPNKGNMQYRISPSTEEGGYYKVMPESGLSLKNFTVYESAHGNTGENEVYGMISKYESDMKIVNFPKNFRIYSILLLDISGSITRKVADDPFHPPVLENLKNASKKFVESINVGGNKLLAVYAFDGRKDLIPVIGYSDNQQEIKSAISSIGENMSRDIPRTCTVLSSTPSTI
jgi:hypothetical protein